MVVPLGSGCIDHGMPGDRIDRSLTSGDAEVDAIEARHDVAHLDGDRGEGLEIAHPALRTPELRSIADHRSEEHTSTQTSR